MRPRTALATGAVAAVAPLAMTGVAVAAPGAPAEKDCKDFDSQKAAQQAFDSDTSDPHNLDHNSNKKACEDWPPGEGDPSNANEDVGGEDGTTAPEGSVDAGGGGTAQDPANVALPLSIAAGATLATAGGVLVIRRYRADSES